MDKLVILDFQTGQVEVFNTDYKEEPDMDELLDSLGHRANDCQWMFTEGDIVIHNTILTDETDK